MVSTFKNYYTSEQHQELLHSISHSNGGINLYLEKINFLYPRNNIFVLVNDQYYQMGLFPYILRRNFMLAENCDCRRHTWLCHLLLNGYPSICNDPVLGNICIYGLEHKEICWEHESLDHRLCPSLVLLSSVHWKHWINNS